jgi:hypothetical protein
MREIVSEIVYNAIEPCDDTMEVFETAHRETMQENYSDDERIDKESEVTPVTMVQINFGSIGDNN